MSPKANRRILALLVFGLTVLPFVAAVTYPSINIDDPDYYAVQRAVTDGLTAKGFVWAFTDLSNAIWMPLTWLCYQFDHTLRAALGAALPGLGGYQTAYSIAHVQSILLHGVNAVLLFLLFGRLARRVDGIGPARADLAAAVAALVWGVHPLRVESVVWIASFKDVLSQAFLLGAVSAWLSFRESGSRPRYVAAHVLFVLACCAKPSAMAYPGIVFLLDALILGRFTLKGFRWERLAVYAPSLLIAFAVAALAQVAQSVGHATVYQSAVPFSYRALNALTSLGVYLRNGLWPTNLAAQNQLQWPRPPHDLMCGAVLGLAVVVLAVRAVRKSARELGGGVLVNRWATAGLLWFLGAVLPMLGLSGFGSHAFADRFTYLPFAGLSLALLGPLLVGSRPKAAAAALCAAMAALAAASAWQTTFWRNDGTLMRRTLAVDGDRNVIAHVNLARHLYEHHHDAEGITAAADHMRRAYELDPAYCMPSAVVYMMMLGEAGRGDDLPEVETAFMRWLHEAKGLWKSLDQDVAEGLKLLFCETTGMTREQRMRHARAIVDDLLAIEDPGVQQIDYFLYLAGKVMGDERLQAEGIRRLRELAVPYVGQDHAVRFRFLTDNR